MRVDTITPVILTLNEEPNIGRALEHLTWASQIIVVDSFSDDATPRIAKHHVAVRLLQREFDDFAAQWNYGLDHVQTEWVLALDADYVVPPAFVTEVRALPEDPSANSFSVEFEYCVLGRPLRTSLYPARHVLFRRDTCRFYNDGHTQRLIPAGATATLHTRLIHDDRKPLRRWLRDQLRYADNEVGKLLSAGWGELAVADRVRRTAVLGPPAVALYCLLWKRLVLDGWPGWYYTFKRVVAETILSLRLLEKRIGDQGREDDTRPY